MVQESLLAGVWSCFGSCLGKLTGPAIRIHYLAAALVFILMLMVNTMGYRHYLRALDAASNSVKPTIVFAAVAYVLSGAVGIIFFNEDASLQWGTGTLFILAGLTLVLHPLKKKAKDEHHE